MDRFFSDLAQVYRQEIRGLAELGCTYLQLDDPNMAYLCDEKMRENVTRIGEDPNELPRTYAKLINDCIADRPGNMAAAAAGPAIAGAVRSDVVPVAELAVKPTSSLLPSWQARRLFLRLVWAQPSSPP